MLPEFALSLAAACSLSAAVESVAFAGADALLSPALPRPHPATISILETRAASIIIPLFLADIIISSSSYSISYKTYNT